MSASGDRIGAVATSTVVGAGDHLSDLPDNADSVQLGDPLSAPSFGIPNVRATVAGVSGFDASSVSFGAGMPFSGTWLRMFHVNYEDLRSVIGDGFACSVPTRYSGYDPRALRLIGFIDSNEHLAFVLDAASPDPQYGLTEIPTLIEAYGWRVDYVTAVASTLARGRMLPTRGRTRLTTFTSANETDFVVFYKDPHVVAIPAVLGGGWLMLLVRARVLRSAAVAAATDGDVVASAARLETSAGGPVIGDVVAFRCESQLFRGDTLKGPYLVVDSLRAVGSRYGTVRGWCGAPTGAFLDTGDEYPDLHVYYNAEVYGEGRVFTGDNEDAIAQANATLGFAGGIAHARISGEVVRDALDAFEPPNESEWSPEDAWAEAPDTVGLNLVRTWMASRSRTLEHKGVQLDRPLDDAIADAIMNAGGVNRETVNPRYADPAVMTAGGRLVLLVGVGETRYQEDDEGNPDLTTDANTLLGLWRMAAVDEGIALPEGDNPTSEYGIDYVVSYGQTDSPDLIAPGYLDSDRAHHTWVDPDPVAFSVLWFVFARHEFGRDPVRSEQLMFLTGDSVFDNPVLS